MVIPEGLSPTRQMTAGVSLQILSHLRRPVGVVQTVSSEESLLTVYMTTAVGLVV